MLVVAGPASECQSVMRLEGEWHIIRYFRMRPELQPVHIYVTPDNEPIRPDWLAIVHART